MRKFTVAAIAMLAVAGSSAVVYAQHRPWFHDDRPHARLTPEDRLAFLDARIAAVHAGLKLSADQDRLWPPVEAAVRDFAKLRIDRANARTTAPGADRPRDPIASLRERADTMASSADAMKKIADAADPLYRTLDDGQKRRLDVLTHAGGFERGGMRHHHFMERGMDRGMMGPGMMERDFDRGPRDRSGDRGGPERL